MNTIEKNISSYLNLYMFQNVWNEPYSEYRANIKPYILRKLSYTGVFNFGNQILHLPTTREAYYVYATAAYNFHAILRIPNDTWIRLDDLCNTYKILIHLFNTKGIIYLKRSSYIYYDKTTDNILFCIKKETIKKTGTPIENASDMYITIIYDSDYVNDCTVYSEKLDASLQSNVQVKLFNILNENKECATMFINGYEVLIEKASDIYALDEVDIIVDKNIIGSFDVDLSLQENLNEFYSEKDKTSKVLIHMPKALNLDNKVLTHDTLDFFIRTKKNTDYQYKGLYVHRTQYRSITQVTHQDYGIPSFIVDAYRDYLKDQDVIIHVKVRQYDKDNVLIRDKNYIDLLYLHEDFEIVNFLMGRTNFKDLSFWKASHLEKSKYIEMMFDIPDTATPDKIWDFVEALGYYHVVSLICNRVLYTKITDLFKGFVVFTKPFIFQGLDVIPIVYINQKKISFSNITYSNTNDKISISLNKDIVYKIGDIITCELFLNLPNTIYKITPKESDATITVPYFDFSIYEENQMETEYRYIKGINTISDKSYTEITDYIGNIITNKTSSGTEIKFGPLMYDKTFIIQNKYTTYTFEENIDTYINNTQSITIPLTKHAYHTDNDIPILTDFGSSVFLNGKYLIKNIDYDIATFKDLDGNISIKQLNIQNMSYLKNSENHIEVLLTSTDIEDVAYGYLIDNRAYGTNLNLWFESLSLLHIDGFLETNSVYYGDYMDVPIGVYREGAPYEIKTCIPSLIKDFLDTYHTNDDKDRLIILNKYFYTRNKDVSEIQILRYSHQIYSTYLTTIISDIIHEKLKLSYDPDIDKLMESLKDYDHIKQIDIVYQNILDLGYVDIFPIYKEITVEDVEIYRLIHAITKKLLPEDPINSGEVVYV